MPLSKLTVRQSLFDLNEQLADPDGTLDRRGHADTDRLFTLTDKLRRHQVKLAVIVGDDQGLIRHN